MVSFVPGPSELYFTVPDHIRRAVRDGIPSITHRSKAFENIFRETTEGLKTLLGLPADYRIAFVGSATEIFERSLQSLVERNSFHLVNGAFSKKYFEMSHQLKKEASSLTVKEGDGFEEVKIPQGQELIAVTQNETSTGVSLPVSVVANIRNQAPSALIIVDAVSSLPYVELDYNAIDSVFFSVQKGFGLPAGLGVWMYNERCLEKALRMQKAGTSLATFHNLPSLHSFALKNQTPATPNVLSIYLLGKVVGDFLRRGVTLIRKETEYKAAVLYQSLSRSGHATPFVEKEKFRSNTVIAASCPGKLKELVTHLESRGLSPGDGYGAGKSTQLRFANFPAHSRETYDLLTDSLDSFQG
jgi:phosphoserine aminotransferase